MQFYIENCNASLMNKFKRGIDYELTARVK